MIRVAAIVVMTNLPLLASGGAPAPACDEAFLAQLEHRIASGQFGDTQINYEWTHGYGRGEVFVTLRQGEPSTLTLKEYGEPAVSIQKLVPADRLLEILRVAREAGFACVVPIPRRICFTDIGRTSLTIRVGAIRREVFWDGETGVPEPGDTVGILRVIDGLSDVFGTQFDWGPYGTMPYPCGGEDE